MKLLPASFFAATLLGALAVSAEPLTFDFKDPKGVNNAVFKLDAPLESINGTANGITGTVKFDPAIPSDFSGKITIATKSMTVGNSMMQDHMHGDKWMDVANHPEIHFEVASVQNAKTTGTTTTADVTGKITIKGVTKEMTAPVKLSYLKDKLQDRTMGQMKGDLLVLRANFKVKRSDFNIQPGQNEDKVSDDIEISLAVAGGAPKG
jgi:polyisoprenoid-binding protein YceI